MMQIGISCATSPITNKIRTELLAIQTAIEEAFREVNVDYCSTSSTDEIDLMVMWVADSDPTEYPLNSSKIPTLILGLDIDCHPPSPTDGEHSAIRRYNIRRQFYRHDMELLPLAVTRGLHDAGRNIAFDARYVLPWPFGPSSRLTRAEIEPFIGQELPDWELVETATVSGPHALELKRTFKFLSFQNAIDFVTQTAPTFDLMDHHPTWTNVYNRLTVGVCTWVAPKRAVTKKDLLLASYLERWWSVGG